MTSDLTSRPAGKRPPFAVRALRFLWRLATDRPYRNVMAAFWFKPKAVFQPFNTTRPERYPAVFRFVRSTLADGSDVRILSFGCSTGDEVFSLRRHFPQAFIKGIDVNPGNIAVCKRRARRAGDTRLAFETAGSTAGEPAATYDAIFCMAVLRHGGLAAADVTRCDHLIRFEDFAATVAGFDRCLKPGGLLAIRHSNFRLGDTPTGTNFTPLLRRPASWTTPLFGPDNVRVETPDQVDVVFGKQG
jgi:2-polyprenyl-3-methyl-5-hydroxy-6-metoxy-1,4-benzoquinol methylase